MPKHDIRNFFGMKLAPSELELELFERTGTYCRYLSWIPGLRMIAVCNSLSMYATDSYSDIDLFIVTDPNRMWLVRILITWIFHILGVRRYGNLVAGRFCLSFFITTNSFDFWKIAIENDIYLATWVKHLKPILDIGDTYAMFEQSNLDWTRKVLSNSDSPETFEGQNDTLRYMVTKKPNTTERFGWLWDWLDSVLKKVFLPKTLREYVRLGKPWGIIISDDMLKFHKNDRRKEIREEWIRA